MESRELSQEKKFPDQDLKKPSILRTMTMFLIPLILSNALQSVGQLIGMVVIGRYIGVEALAAVSAFFPLFFLIISFVIGIGSGSSILIGQAFGAKNEERVKAVVGTTLTFTFLLGIVLAVVGGIFTEDILKLIGTPDNIIDVSAHYARILFWSMPALFLYFVYTTFMRGTGDSKTPLNLLIISTLLNVGLLPFLMFGWIGLPKFGLYGAAYASVISTILTLFIMIYYLKRVNHSLRFDQSVAQHLKMDKELLKLLLKLGIPSSVNMILVSLSEIAVISFVNAYGSDATAAYGVVNQVASYVQMPAISLGITVSVFAAQAIGGNRLEELGKVIRVGILLNYIIGGVIITFIYLFSKELLSLFVSEANTIDIANRLVMITLWSYLIFGHAQIIAATMRASGTVLWPTTFGIIAIWLVEVPVAYILSHFMNFGIEGIWIGYPAAFIVSLVLQYLYYRLSWKKKRIVRLV